MSLLRASRRISTPPTSTRSASWPSTSPRVLEADPVLQDVWLRGEVTNVSRSPAGHYYFNSEGRPGSLRCVLFRGSAFNSPIMPANGLALVAHGNVRFYDRHGIVRAARRPALSRRRRRWARCSGDAVSPPGEPRACSSPSRKRPLPTMPRAHRRGLVRTRRGHSRSAQRARATLSAGRGGLRAQPGPGRRRRGGHGARAPSAGRLAARRRGVDVIVLARGGGSDEDLAAFNDERLARAIFASPGAGRVGGRPRDEPDPGPTGSPTCAPRHRPPRPSCWRPTSRPCGATCARSDQRARTRRSARASPAPPSARSTRRGRLGRPCDRRLQVAREQLQAQPHRLRALSPAATLGRGYAIARLGGAILRDADAGRAPGDGLRIELHRGRLTSTVQAVEPEVLTQTLRTGAIASCRRSWSSSKTAAWASKTPCASSSGAASWSRVCQRIVDEAELRVTRLAAESASPLAEPRAGPTSRGQRPMEALVANDVLAACVLAWAVAQFSSR